MVGGYLSRKMGVVCMWIRILCYKKRNEKDVYEYGGCFDTYELVVGNVGMSS